MIDQNLSLDITFEVGSMKITTHQTNAENFERVAAGADSFSKVDAIQDYNDMVNHVTRCLYIDKGHKYTAATESTSDVIQRADDYITAIALNRVAQTDLPACITVASRDQILSINSYSDKPTKITYQELMIDPNPTHYYSSNDNVEVVFVQYLTALRQDNQRGSFKMWAAAYLTELP